MAEGGHSGWQLAQDLMPMGEKSLPTLRESGQWDQTPPQDDPWKFLCLAVTLVMFLLVTTLGVVLGNVLQLNYQIQEELNQLNNKFTQGLADAKHNRDIFRGELFRQMEAVQAGNGSSCNPCPKAWMAFEGSCYNFTTNELSCFKAKDQCTQEGARLVIINSQAEQKFLTTSQEVTYWIGLTKRYKNGPYEWQDGSALTYTNWVPEILHQFDCVYMDLSGHWDSTFDHEDSSSSWICEKPQIC